VNARPYIMVLMDAYGRAGLLPPLNEIRKHQARIMNGVEVETLDCGLNPDGTLKSVGK